MCSRKRFVLHNESPVYKCRFRQTGQLCPFCRGTYRQARRSAPDLLPSSCLQHSTRGAQSQELFLYLELEAVLFFPFIAPSIFAPSKVVQVTDTIRIFNADVLAAPKFAAGKLCHYLEYQSYQFLLKIFHNVRLPQDAGGMWVLRSVLFVYSRQAG